ncbi:MAG: LysE family translocator [Porticoccaceae bacterium]|jgi:threonine/homoserine/homoserine lactone efflux protein|tara:strand:- start:2572 stop:3210 length:639 start_codon:yes stop_codon:yes gene_type:complete
MDTQFWLSVTLACLFGAMSPGPSLAVIIATSVTQNRAAGLLAAVSHGLTVGLYALTTALGLAFVLSHYEGLFFVIQLAGCLFLLHLAVKLLLTSRHGPVPPTPVPAGARVINKWWAIRDGCLIALLNPKIMFFFTALFSQFVSEGSSLWQKVVMALIAAVVDMGWYSCVAVLLSQPHMVRRYEEKSHWFSAIFGVFLLALSVLFTLKIINDY